jgi:hypothetical protein
MPGFFWSAQQTNFTERELPTCLVVQVWRAEVTLPWQPMLQYKYVVVRYDNSGGVVVEKKEPQERCISLGEDFQYNAVVQVPREACLKESLLGYRY